MLKKRLAVLALTTATFTGAPVVSLALPGMPQDNGNYRNDHRDDQQNDHRDNRQNDNHHDNQQGDRHDNRQSDRRDEQANRGNHRDDNYSFRSEDASRLRQNYRNTDRVDRNHRAHYARGERLPNGWRGRMEPVPETVVRELPPPPPGDRFGYLDGYAVAYNPTTQIIADVLDIATVAANSRR